MTNPEIQFDPHAATIFARLNEGKIEDAQHLADDWLEKNPKDPVVWYLRGVIHREQGSAAGALTAFNNAVKFKPDFRKACEDMARLLIETGQTEMAFKTYMHYLKIRVMEESLKPREAVAGLSAASDKALRDYVLKSQAMAHEGRLDEAVQMAQKAHVIHPRQPEVMINLGIMLNAMARYEEAEEHFFHALSIQPTNALGYNMLGNAYKNRAQFGKAIAAYRLAVEMNPKLSDALINLGKTYFEMQLFTESAEAYERTIEAYPKYLEALSEVCYLRDLLCRWHADDRAHERMLEEMNKGTQPAEPFLALLYADRKLQIANAMRWTVKIAGTQGRWDKTIKLPAQARGDKKLRIGYQSSDFHRHATLALISEMFEQHDREKFEIYAYSFGRDDGMGERQRVKKAVDCFRDMFTADDAQAAEVIRRDGIDILVDLKGYTQGHRLGLMARRPAPVQMHYLGYPGTTGTPFIDYFLADNIAAPEGEDKYFSEKLIRLPHSYQINDRNRPLPKDGPTRAEYGLPEDAFVFCGFNNPYKIRPEMFSLWMRLLKAVPGSVLWLMETHKEVREHLKEEAKARGVDPERVITVIPVPLAEHLKRYRHADLFLDSTPVCGHTTSSDSLWCAVPVVTLKGESFIGRVAASLLGAVGLPELVVTDMEAYEALALALARDPKRLKALSEHLEKGRMKFPLFDSVATTRAIEAAYLHAAEIHRNGEPPRAFTLAPDLSVA